MALVREGFENLCDEIQNAIAEMSKTLSKLRLVPSRPELLQSNPYLLHIDSQQNLDMSVKLYNISSNYANETQMLCDIYRPPDLIRKQSAVKIREISFRPTFNLPKELVWVGSARKQVFTTKELAAHLLVALMTELEKQIQRP